MYIERGDGTRVRIPVAVEQDGAEAVAAFLRDVPKDAIVPSEPEPVPAEQRTASAQAADPTQDAAGTPASRRGRTTPTPQES
jgi:hypothetical protein